MRSNIQLIFSASDEYLHQKLLIQFVYLSESDTFQIKISYMPEKQPCPLCKTALVKHNQLTERLYRYMFDNAELNISHNEGIISYTAVYDLIDKNAIQKMANEKIYELYELTFSKIFKSELKHFCERVRQVLIEFKGMASHQDCLKLFYQWFTKYTRFLFWNRVTFVPIEKNHKIYNKSSLYHEGLMILKQQIVQPLYDTLEALAISNLEQFKEGKLQEYFQLQYVIKMIGMCGFFKFKNINLEKNELDQFQFVSINKDTKEHSEIPYQTDFFRKKFTPSIITFLQSKYKNISEQMLNLSTPEYVQEALNILQKQEKAADYFYPHHKVKNIVIRQIERVLIMEKAEALLSKEKTGLSSLFQIDDTQSLINLYRLVKRTSQQKLFCQHLQAYVEKKIVQILNRMSPEEQKMAKKEIVKEIVEEVFNFYLKVEKITYQIHNAIKDKLDLILFQSLKIAFQAACNKNPTISNFLVYYSDSILKREDSAQNNTAELTFKISKMVKLLYSLDQFLKTYQRMLGVRILYDVFKNKNAEMDIINLLKSQVGVSSMNKINMMIQDYRFSEQFNLQYSPEFKEHFPFNFQVMMLTSGSWAIKDLKQGKELVPPELFKAVNFYQNFYEKTHPGREITWIFNYGRSLVIVRFNSGKYILHINNYQLLVLLYLERNSFKKAKISQLLSEIKPEEEPGFMASISMLVKKGILIKTGKTPKIQDKSEVVEFNANFKSKTPKIGCFQVPRLTQKSNALNSQLNADRAILIQASIVKLMKAKRVLRYNEIIPEVIKMCKTFKAQTSMVKNQIELCIHKEFLERDQKDLNTLIYKP